MEHFISCTTVYNLLCFACLVVCVAGVDDIDIFVN